MKRVLIFSLAYYPRVGGAEVSIKEITDRITDVEWHMVTMRFSSADAKEEKLGNVVVHRVGSGAGYLSKILFVPRAAAAARALNRAHRFDGAWAMMSYMLLPIVWAGLNIPYALTLQEGDTQEHMFGRLRILPFLPMLRRGFRNARAVSALSTFLAGWARQMGYHGEVVIVPNGTDVQKFAGAHVPHDGVVVVSTSRLVNKNALDDIIRALPLLPPHVRFINYGFGPDQAKLEALARGLGIEERVELLPHPGVPNLPRYLHQADIFARPSRSEGFGISFAEAMAAGLPVIATQEGGLKDYITPEVAWVVDKDQPEQIAAQIKAILGNPAHTAKVTESARQMVAQKYDWSLIARDMRDKVFARLFA